MREHPWILKQVSSLPTLENMKTAKSYCLGCHDVLVKKTVLFMEIQYRDMDLQCIPMLMNTNVRQDQQNWPSIFKSVRLNFGCMTNWLTWGSSKAYYWQLEIWGPINMHTIRSLLFSSCGWFRSIVFSASIHYPGGRLTARSLLHILT